MRHPQPRGFRFIIVSQTNASQISSQIQQSCLQKEITLHFVHKRTSQQDDLTKTR